MAKVGSGVRPHAYLVGRRILRFREESRFAGVTWAEIGKRFGVCPDHARDLARIASEIPPKVIRQLGIYKCKVIVNGKVPRDHLKPIFRIAKMSEEKELRKLIRTLYGDPKLRDQIQAFPCIRCYSPIGYERMSTMQCAKCDSGVFSCHA